MNMDKTETNYMQVAKDAFNNLSPNDRLIFLHWGQKIADADLYGTAAEERSAFGKEVKEGLGDMASQAQELGKKAAQIVREGKDTLDEKLRGFLGKDNK